MHGVQPPLWSLLKLFHSRNGKRHSLRRREGGGRVGEREKEDPESCVPEGKEKEFK